MKPADAIFFLSFGGPEKSNEIMPFLKIVTHGRGIPEARLKNVAHHYEELGGASPIHALTLKQVQAVEKKLRSLGIQVPVYYGNKNWKPFIIHELKKMQQAGHQEVLAFITAAHRCDSGHQSYIQTIQKSKKLLGNTLPHITYPDPWHTHPLFIDAICERIKEVVSNKEYAISNIAEPPTPHHLLLTSSEYHWIFVAHSIPTPMAQRSLYAQDLQETATRVCKKLGKSEWHMAYCSRSGRPTDPWLEPDINDELKRLAATGVKKFLIIPSGFLVDHVEVLYDLDREAQQTAQELGVQLLRAGTVGDHPLFIDMIVDVLKKTADKVPLRIIPAPEPVH